MSHGYQNRRICAVQAFCAAKSWRRWDSLPPSILITLGLSRLRRVKQKTRRVARHKRFRFAKTLVHKQFICLCAVKCPTDTKKKSTALRCSSFWWTWRDSNPRPYGCERIKSSDLYWFSNISSAFGWNVNGLVASFSRCNHVSRKRMWYVLWSQEMCVDII